MTFTTAAFDRSSSWRFETLPRTAPKGPPSSLVQLSHLLDTTPPSLLTTAACGGLRPAPDCRPRRALLHLSYSSALSYSDSAFVTHAPFPTLAETARIAQGVIAVICRADAPSGLSGAAGKIVLTSPHT